MRIVKIGNAMVSGLCIGGNPFSGFSHQNVERNQEMKEYYTKECIKRTLRDAETAGMNTFFGRTDDYTLGYIKENWDEGGKIQWFSQVCITKDDPDCWQTWLQKSIDHGAAGAYIHGGVVDNWYATEQFDKFDIALDMMRAGGIAAGFAGHNHFAHKWISENLDVDFQMCSHYNPTDRSIIPHHSMEAEVWDDRHRDLMLEVISTITKPVIHYKIFAGGNKPIVPAFELLGKIMKPEDIALIGVFPKDNQDMIKEDIDLFEKYVD